MRRRLRTHLGTGTFQFQQNGHAPIRFGVGRQIRHGLGVGESGNFEHLLRNDAALDELAACGVGALGGQFPFTVSFATALRWAIGTT